MLSKTIHRCKPYKLQITQCLTRSTVSKLSKTNDKVEFNSISTAYGYKSTRELFRGWLVFKLCSYKSLVNNLSQVNQKAEILI